jgi:hypothetical protein
MVGDNDVNRTKVKVSGMPAPAPGQGLERCLLLEAIGEPELLRMPEYANCD